MSISRHRTLLAGILVAASVAGSHAQESTRAATPDQYKWNLADLYASDDAWRAEQSRLEKEMASGASYAGTLAQSAARLQEALDVSTDLDKALNRLATYASLKADEDTRVANAQGMRDQVIQLGATFGAAWAFLEPEVLTMDAATVDTWIASTPGLKQVRVLPARHPAAKGAHAERQRRGTDGAGDADGRRQRHRREHPAQRGPAVADSHAVRRQAGEARRPGVLGGARVGEPGGSEEGDGGLLQRARQLPQDAWRDDERERAGRDLPRKGQALRHDAAGRARRGQHSRPPSTRRSWTASTSSCRRSIGT